MSSPILLSTSPESLPDEWVNSSVFRFIDDPLSPAAFAEPYKSCIDLGPIDMDACVSSSEAYAIQHFTYKSPGDELQIPPETPSGLVTAHDLFVSAAKRIIGDAAYLQADVRFTYRYSKVTPGTYQTELGPHIDGVHKYFDKKRPPLILIGLACNILPTILLQGPMKPEQLRYDGFLKNLEILKHLTETPLPIGRLILAPQALLHDVARADANLTESIDRLFMRWFLRV